MLKLMHIMTRLHLLNMHEHLQPGEKVGSGQEILKGKNPKRLAFFQALFIRG